MQLGSWAVPYAGAGVKRACSHANQQHWFRYIPIRSAPPHLHLPPQVLHIRPPPQLALPHCFHRVLEPRAAVHSHAHHTKRACGRWAVQGTGTASAQASPAAQRSCPSLLHQHTKSNRKTRQRTLAQHIPQLVVMLDVAVAVLQTT